MIKRMIMIGVALLIGMVALTAVPGQAAMRISLGLVGGRHPVDDDAYRSIYGNGSFMAGVRAGLRSRLVEIRAELDLSKDHGAMTESGEDLALTLKSQILALRIVPIETGRLRAFVGAGLGTMSIRESYPERIEDYTGSATLSMVEAGVDLRLMSHLSFAAEMRYVNAKADTSMGEGRIDLGGLRPCLGVTYTF